MLNMAVIREIKYRFKQIITPVIAISIIGYLAYHSIQGDRGIFAYVRLNIEVAKAEKNLSNLQSSHAEIAKKTSYLHPNSLDADMLDEVTRHTLNFAKINEIIIFNK